MSFSLPFLAYSFVLTVFLFLLQNLFIDVSHLNTSMMPLWGTTICTLVLQSVLLSICREMDVLDDIRGEALEVQTANNWLNYGEQLHRLREFGAAIKEMDLIDESTLSSEQMAVIVSCLVHTGNVRDLPHPDEDWDAFLAEIKKNQPESRWIYDPVKAKAQPWIDVKNLTRQYSKGGGSSACVLS